MKKIILALALAMLLTGCAKSKLYIVPGYYSNGEIITEDGNVWGYTSENLSNGNVNVLFNSNGTEIIYDDIIVGIVNK